MGMYDTLHFLDDGAPRCPAGHPVRELQTKDLDEEMRHIYVFDGRTWAGEARVDPVPALDGGVLVLTRTSRLEHLPHTGELAIYASCDDCLPVLTYEERSLHDAIREHRPFLEWTLTLVKGEVVELRPDRLDGRETLRAKLEKQGLEVLSDDDRIAVRHFRKPGPRRRW